MFTLRDLPIFSELEKEQLEMLQAGMHIHHYNRDSVVFYEGESSDYLHILLDGTVRLYKTNPKGTQVHMHNFAAPEIVALFPAFENVPFPATCEFLTEGVIGLIPIEKIRELLEYADFTLRLIATLSRRMKLLAELFHKETIYSSEAKVADIIYTNSTVFERLKNSEIASILNMTPETLSRTLTKFKKEEIIAIDNHVISILNQDALINIIDANIIVQR